MYYVVKSLIGQFPTNLDPEKEQHDQARIKAVANLQRLHKSREGDALGDGDFSDSITTGRLKISDLALDQYESQIAMEVVSPEDIPVGFEGL